MSFLKTVSIVMIGLALTSAAWADHVGFQTTTLPNPAGKPLRVGIWYPTDATPASQPLGEFTQSVASDAPVKGSALPLVVILHGSGGSFSGHYDTAQTLARSGFVAASITHEGDSFDDRSRTTEVWIRPAQLRQLTDFMLLQWPDHARLDPHRIGAFGYSAGGFTVLVAAGGVPDVTRVPVYCATHAATDTCRIVAASAGGVQRFAAPLPPSTWIHDKRIKAAVVAAPAVGFAFGTQGLRNVRIPIQLWRAQFDHVLPYPDYAEAVRKALPIAPEYHVVDNAEHLDFLAPCSPVLVKNAPDICRERAGFDRAAFHDEFNARIVAFFERTLAPGGAVPGNRRRAGAGQ
jgi:predicted dienelactone hydrolase